MNDIISQKINLGESPIKFKAQYNEKNLLKRVFHACLREELISYVVVNNFLIVDLIKTNKTIICKNVQVLELKKLKFNGDIFVISTQKCSILTTVKQLLTLIYKEIKDSLNEEGFKQLKKEIYNCAIHERLVFSFLEKDRLLLKTQIKSGHKKSFIEFVTENNTIEEQLIFFESFAAKGHPYHPCYKTKLGFTIQDYLKYSPEFKSNTKVFLAAIHKRLVNITGYRTQKDYQHWFANNFPKQWESWRIEIEKRKLIIDDFCPLFIHPWQGENVLSTLFKSHIDKDDFIIFHHESLEARPTLSFRTLAPLETTQPHIKLPVAVYCTSAMRTVTPSSVHNGPNFCRVLKEILKEENHFDQTLQLAAEIGGLYIHSHPTNIAKHLSILYRENPALLVEKNQTPIVVAALFENSPISNKPLFIELIHQSCGETFDHAIEYFNEYCFIVLRSYFDLFLKYGCALEGHQQNTIAVFENYRPKYMISRDSGGIRLHMQTLRKNGYDFNSHPDSSILYENRQDVTDLFIHTVLQYHLGELALLLEDYYQNHQKEFWKIIASQLNERFLELKPKTEKDRWEAEYDSILKNNWHIKCLLKMRLKNDAYEYETSSISNPLKNYANI